jgi:hypothetical protein
VVVRDTVAQDTVRGPSPRGAFLRSLVIPGWGQASVGSYTRGGIFFAIQSTSGYMLAKTIARLNQARDRESFRVAAARDSLFLLMQQDTAANRRLSDPLAFEEAVSDNPNVAEARDLVESREQQRQDWITYTIFFTLMSGVDAYVSAHLRNLPGELSAEPRSDGGFALSVKIPLGRAR